MEQERKVIDLSIYRQEKEKAHELESELEKKKLLEELEEINEEIKGINEDIIRIRKKFKKDE